MSTPTRTSRKRKADALEAADDAESPSGRKLKVATAATPSAHLPASCLAAILDFMEYAEVRRCLLAGKIVAVDAARHVETLNIMNASELVPSAARRFANVAEINILSLVASTDEDDILSAGTATRSVPFLISFPKLKRAFLGGLFWDGEEWSKMPYLPSICREPEDHLTIFRGLVDYLCGAFQSRSLSSSLHLEGVFERQQVKCHESRRCRRCWNVTTSFPLELVLEQIPKRHFFRSVCLDYSERIEALATRHDKPFLLQPQAVFKCFLAMTKAMIASGRVDSPRESRGEFDDEKKSFIQRIESQGGWYNRSGSVSRVSFHFISVKNMEALKKFSTAIGPSVMNTIAKREFLSAVPQFGATDDGKKRVLVRQTFEGLVQLGFDLASKDFVLIDPLNEAALKRFHDYFRPEEEAS